MIDFTEKFLQPIGGLLNKTIELQSPTEDMKYKVLKVVAETVERYASCIYSNYCYILCRGERML